MRIPPPARPSRAAAQRSPAPQPRAPLSTVQRCHACTARSPSTSRTSPREQVAQPPGRSPHLSALRPARASCAQTRVAALPPAAHAHVSGAANGRRLPCSSSPRAGTASLHVPTPLRSSTRLSSSFPIRSSRWTGTCAWSSTVPSSRLARAFARRLVPGMARGPCGGQPGSCPCVAAAREQPREPSFSEQDRRRLARPSMISSAPCAPAGRHPPCARDPVRRRRAAHPGCHPSRASSLLSPARLRGPRSLRPCGMASASSPRPVRAVPPPGVARAWSRLLGPHGACARKRVVSAPSASAVQAPRSNPPTVTHSPSLAVVSPQQRLIELAPVTVSSS
jgi:hypothetical protein